MARASSSEPVAPALALLIALYLGAIVSANATAAKLFTVYDVHITSGAFAIPIVYLTTDLINELYGRRNTVTVVWMGFGANLVLIGMSQVALAAPVAPFGASQDAFEQCFDITWRVAVASSVAYLVSSRLDVEIFHAIRVLTRGRAFWLRKNGSTIISQAVDTGIFVLVAFAGTMPWEALVAMATGQYLVKIAAAPLGTPLSYAVLWYAKRTREQDPWAGT